MFPNYFHFVYWSCPCRVILDPAIEKTERVEQSGKQKDDKVEKNFFDERVNDDKPLHQNSGLIHFSIGQLSHRQ